MNNSTNHQSTSGPAPPKPSGKRPSSTTPSPTGTSHQLTWEQKYAVLREKHVWLLMHSQGKERENKKLTTQVIEGVMELEMMKEWTADQLEELDLWRKGIYIHPDHQVKVPVSHENTASPVSIGAPELADAAGSFGPLTENSRSYGVQDSIEQNILKDLGIPSNLANDFKCDEDFSTYHQFIDDASQTPQAPLPVQFPNANNIRLTGTYLRGPVNDGVDAQAPPPEQTVPNIRLSFPSHNDNAAAQISRYQKLLAEDRFLKMTEKHE
ncbi:unnamed protein product [Caenorhabditis brenneri]